MNLLPPVGTLLCPSPKVNNVCSREGHVFCTALQLSYPYMVAKLHGTGGDKIVYCTSHPWMPSQQAGSRGFPKDGFVHPAGSKSIRRNSDVSPIAGLVDHENSIHTRPLMMSSTHLAVTEITFLSRDPKFMMMIRPEIKMGVGYTQSS